MTSLIVFVYEGSGLKMLIQLLIAFVFLALMKHTRPYVEESNNHLAIAVQLTLLVIALIGLMNRVQLSTKDGSVLQQQVLDRVLEVATVFPLVLAFLQILADVRESRVYAFLPCFNTQAYYNKVREDEGEDMSGTSLRILKPGGLLATVAASFRDYSNKDRAKAVQSAEF